MRKVTILVLAASMAFALYQYINLKKPAPRKTQTAKKKERGLLCYTFDSLKKTAPPESDIVLDRVTEERENSKSQVFYFSVPEKPGSDRKLKVSGLMNLPNKPGTYPVIVMFRGFVPDNIYEPGVGTQHAAETLAENGYVTLAPDFLGFAQSDPPSRDSFEARFQTYTTALSLMASLKTMNSGLEASYSGLIKADTDRIGIWGHSNGGHIALSILAMSGVSYPTVLWAPVSKSFPYSILYYTDEADDQGKALRKVLASFEEEYDASLFSPSGYYGWIKAPVSIQQGQSDREVPVYWSDDLVNELEENGVEVEYNILPGADHNLMPSWSAAMSNSVLFFNKHFPEIE